MLKGYVLEAPRVGASNSPFTATPNNYIFNSTAFNTAYPSSESNPRTDYLVFVDTTDGNLPTAKFAWTKNEGVVSGTTQVPFARFDFEGATQRFKPLPGGPLDIAGTLSSTANTTHLKVPTPTIADLTNFPVRVSVGASGSGTTFAVVLVANDAALMPLPSSGSVKLSRQSGKLAWNAADLVSYDGQLVRFQRQSFFTYQNSSGRIGGVSDVLLLNPIPKTGQVPLVRIGAGLPLTAVEVASEGAFGSPASGTFQWARNTGRLRLNATDVSAAPGQGVYYDGVVFARNVSLSTTNIGSMPASYTSVTFTAPAIGGDLVFRVGSTQFPQVVLVDSFADSTGQSGTVQVKITGLSGEARFSADDRSRYTGQTIQLTIGDLVVDHGVSLRLFRNPVNPDAADPTLKDVASIYAVERAILAQPMIAQPMVFLPARPIDAAGYPISVYVEQGMGSFTGPLPRLDVPSPPTGLGVVFDYDQGTVQYAQRKTGVLAPLIETSGAVALPDQLIFAGNTSLELETAPGSGTYAPLTIGTDALFDALSGVVSFVTTQGTLVMTGGGSTSGGALVATSGNFLTSGVQPGDVVLISGTAAAGLYLVRSITSASQIALDVVGPDAGPFTFEVRRGREVLADRFFDEVVLADPATKVEKIRALGTPTNSPRLSVSTEVVGRVGFRFDATTHATTVVVANDSLFTSPGSLAAGTVQVSQATGNINLSTADVTAYTTVYQVVRLRQQVDYKIVAGLGLINFTERLLAYDEARITYVPLDDEGNKLPVVTEDASFLVRLEVTQPHTSPTNTLRFNPSGRRLAASPLPQVYRGGRPQVLGEQCVIDPTTSTITFLPDSQVTDALPHGSIIEPEERVYVNYYVAQALGGESTTSVLQTPMSITQLTIKAGATSFTLAGDWTTSFPANYMLRIEAEEVYLISESVYDVTSETTTVRIASPQEFNTDYSAPKVYVSSGVTPFATTPFQPSYFVTETAVFDPIPRGSNQMVLTGDHTGTYKQGTIVGTTDATANFLRFYEVTGVSYDASTGKTTAKFAGSTSRQVVYGQQIVKHTVRPVFTSASTELTTSRVPVLSQPYTLYRRTTGLPGTPLGEQPNAEYRLDDAGKLTLSTPLAKNEEIGLLYTGHSMVEAGRNVRAAYTAIIAPSVSNGLLNQALRMDYSLYAPDTFYFRVETFANFRGELAQQYADEAKATSPSGGPTTSNSSAPQLFEQGRPSLYFNEGRYANEDIVARSTLKFYNDAINLLEDVLADFDGRVVGGRSGRFKFDGNLTNAAISSGDLADATNQIDDQIKISDGPYQVTMSGLSFTLTPLGTYRALWEPSVTSRFYPTYRRSYGVAAAGTQTGDQILGLGAQSVQSASNVRTRPAFALITVEADAAVSALTVDVAQGEASIIRPAFLTGMKCVIQRADGTFLKGVGAEVVVFSATATTITLTAPLGVTVPAGSTIYRSPADDSNFGGDPKQPGANANFHFSGSSYGVDNDNGILLYVKAFPPLDGSVPLVPDALVIKQIPAGMPLDTDTYYSNRRTAPYRAPVFDGGTLDDDGNVSLPLVGPTLKSEVPTAGVGLLDTELTAISLLTGGTQAPYVGTGTLNVAKTVLTLSSGTFPSPVPETYDLVRITTGNNAASAYRRITVATPTAITVDTPFTFTESGAVNFLVTVSGSTVSGAATIVGTTLTDGLATFNTSVDPGQTVVMTSGAAAGERRQIVAVLSGTQLQLSSTIAANGNYRVDDSLATYSGPALTTLTTTLASEVAVLSTQTTPTQNEIDAVEAVLDLAFTDIETGTGSAAGASLSDGLATFVTSGVSVTDFVYIRSGAAKGIYQITAILSETQVTTSPAFPTPSLATYRVVSGFGVTYESMVDLFGILSAADTFLADSQALQASAAQFQVVRPGPTVDTAAWATGLTGALLTARSATVTARKAQVPGEVSQVTSILRATEKLYDKRFVWIDTRINMEKGLLVKQGQAVANRLKAQADLISQLTKLLAVQT